MIAVGARKDAPFPQVKLHFRESSAPDGCAVTVVVFNWKRPALLRRELTSLA
jgi:hypothetical protein